MKDTKKRLLYYDCEGIVNFCTMFLKALLISAIDILEFLHRFHKSLFFIFKFDNISIAWYIHSNSNASTTLIKDSNIYKSY